MGRSSYHPSFGSQPAAACLPAGRRGMAKQPPPSPLCTCHICFKRQTVPPQSPAVCGDGIPFALRFHRRPMNRRTLMHQTDEIAPQPRQRCPVCALRLREVLFCVIGASASGGGEAVQKVATGHCNDVCITYRTPSHKKNSRRASLRDLGEVDRTQNSL